MTKTKECRELAAAVATKIRNEPASHHQGTWALFLASAVQQFGKRDDRGRILVNCNTTGCVAGWASMLSGDLGVIRDVQSADLLTLPGDTEPSNVYSIGTVVTPDGRHLDIQDRGAELLCLNADQVEWLFAGDRTRTEVLFALDELAANKPISRRVAFTRKEMDSLSKPQVKTRIERVVAERKSAAKTPVEVV